MYPLASVNADEVIFTVGFVGLVVDGDVGVVGVVVEGELGLIGVVGDVGVVDVLVRYFMVPSGLIKYLFPLDSSWTGKGWAPGVLAMKYLLPVESVKTIPSGYVWSATTA